VNAGIMSTSVVRIGIAGCGLAARIHLDRLLALENVEVIGCADPDLPRALALADRASVRGSSSPGGKAAPAFSDHRELLRQQTPDALAIFTPHLSHYRLTMDALQAGCHVFVEKPLTTNSQEAADIVSLARGRGLKVGVGHQFRLCPSLIEARRRLAAGEIGPVRMVTALLARPWLSTLSREESTWRFDPKVAGSGILADAGDHLIDALLWTTGQKAGEVGAIQSQRNASIDLVTAAFIRLLNETPVSLAVSGIAARAEFVLTFYGEAGQLHATDQQLFDEKPDGTRLEVALPSPEESIDGNFISALLFNTPLCCPADEALESVRLLEAIGRSAATGQLVRLI
jgi:predicted dehydrogenase